MTTIRNLLQKYHLRPSKHLGQNFLIDKKALQKIIQAADLSPEDTILEIGPGLGVLTEELAKRTEKVMAVEKDKRMIGLLKEGLKDYKNVEIIEADILDFLKRKFGERILGAASNSIGAASQNPPKISASKISASKSRYKVVANLPFYIASPIIRMFLEAKNPPEVLVLMVQKEVAQRICAKPPKMSLLAISVQFYAEPKIISYVSKNSFWPRPKVDSAIIKIAPLRFGEQKFWERILGAASNSIGAASQNPPKISVPKSIASRDKFFKIVRAGFSSPRKQLANNLSRGLKIDKEKIKKALLDGGLNPEIRAEGLSIENWIKLARKMD